MIESAAKYVSRVRMPAERGRGPSTPGARVRAAAEALEGRTFLSAAAAASSGAPHVYDQGSTVRGDTLGEWAAQWLQWALSAPADENPLLDTTGEFAGVGQPKDVFFLGGTLGPGTATREITVPTGTPLFFPVLNSFWVNVDEAVPGVYPVADPPFAENEAAIRADFDAHTDAYTGLFATVDGVAVPDLAGHVEEDPPGGISLDFPENNVFGLPPEILGLGATQGVYLMLAPLKRGEHVIHFGGTDPLFNFSLDVTYEITVVPKGQYRQDSSTALASRPAIGGTHAVAPGTFSKASVGRERLVDDILGESTMGTSLIPKVIKGSS